MPAAAPSWQLIDLRGSWNNQDGTRKAGTYEVTVPVEITNQTDQVRVPAGVWEENPLSTTAGSPSLSIQVPCTNDPDNDPQPNGWKLIVKITFTDGSASETYSVDALYADRPTADGGTGNGTNLLNYVAATALPQTVTAYKIGVPGGLAELNQAGQVVDASGTPITGGGGGGTGDVVTVNGVSPDVSGNVTVTAAGVGLGNVDNTHDSNKSVASAAQLTTARTIALSGPVTGSVGFDGTANVTMTTSLAGGTLGEQVLDANTTSDFWGVVGNVPVANVPAQSTFTAANQAARLALSAAQGDVAVQSDTGVTYRLKQLPASTDANWVALSSASPVTSVAGHTGVVTLTSSDVGLSNVTNTSDVNKPVSTAQQAALDGKLNVDTNGAATIFLGFLNADPVSPPANSWWWIIA